jgi:Ca2+-binding EF-hand superfamily protein
MIATLLAGMTFATFPVDDDSKDKRRPADGDRKRDPGVIIQRLDRNGDGKIGKDEIEAAPERARQYLGRADRNGDGEITKDEMPRAGAGRPRKGNDGGPPKGEPGKTPAAGDERNRKFAKGAGDGMPALKRLDVNGDGRISRDEAKGPLAASFDAADADKDGFLTEAELRATRERVGKNKRGKGGGKTPSDMPPPGKGVPSKGGMPEFSMLLQRMDSNGDGKVSKNEARGPFAENFDRFDTNRDGFLAKGEVDEVGRRLQARKGMGPGLGGGQPSLVNLFNQQDADADGRVSKSEAKGKLADEFDRLDVDKDGNLSRQEVEAGLKKAADTPPVKK